MLHIAAPRQSVFACLDSSREPAGSLEVGIANVADQKIPSRQRGAQHGTAGGSALGTIASSSRSTSADRYGIGGENMNVKTIVAAALLAAFVTPAFAADEFYVVQDVKTKKCTVVDQKPVDTTTTVVSPSGTIYKTRSEAETGMKTVKVCTSD
ncbi:hypothetical protein ACVWW1_001760 [Bradyrhizobium sp. JR3.5]